MSGLPPMSSSTAGVRLVCFAEVRPRLFGIEMSIYMVTILRLGNIYM